VARAREPEPWVELATLEGAASKALARGYALRGEERYFRERAVTALRARAEALGYEVCLHDVGRESEGSDFRLARLVDDLSGGGLFAARRLVVVRNPGELLKKQEGEDSPLTRALLSFLASGEEPGTVVLSDSSLRVDHAVVKALLARGGLAPAFRRLWETPPPWKPDPMGSELVAWTQRRARELGCPLSAEQALFVSAATGNDLAAIDDQLATIKSSGGRDPRASVRWVAGGTPWNVAEQLLSGQLARSLSGLEALFQGGFQDKSGKRLLEPAALAALLIGALQRGASQSLMILTAGDEAPPSGSPTQRESALALARMKSVAQWRAFQEEVSGLERALKSGGGVEASDFTRLALRWAASPRTKVQGAKR
jgi:DNA polymerase III delta subunit